MSRFFSSKFSALTTYTPGEQPRQQIFVKLNTNESPFPPAPKAIAMAQEAAANLHLYSDPTCKALVEAAARYYGIEEDEILFTNGSDDILNFDFASWDDGTSYWGKWDSVEKFLYRNGGGVTVEPVDFKYSWVTNDAGESVSDHASAECVFEFTVTEDFVANTQELTIVKANPFRNLLNTIKWIIKDLMYFFSHFDELMEFLG